MTRIILTAFSPRTRPGLISSKELSGELAPSCQILKREVKAGREEAAVDQSFRLEGLVAGKKRSYSEEEKLVLKREGRGWKIVSGSGLYAIFAGRPVEEDRIKRFWKSG